MTPEKVIENNVDIQQVQPQTQTQVVQPLQSVQVPLDNSKIETLLLGILFVLSIIVGIKLCELIKGVLR